MKFSKFFKFSLSNIVVFFFGALALMGAGASAYTSIVWLRTGKWAVYPFLDLLIKIRCVNEFGSFCQWFYYPNSWLGFHAVCQNIFQYPMYLVLIGMIFFGLTLMFGDT